MKKKLILLLFICMYIIIPTNTYAATSLKITNKITNIRNSIDSTITYQIKPHTDNPQGVENDLTSYTIDFTDVEVIDNTITKEDEIDFSTVHYTIPGTYRYGIIQESSSDKSIVLEKKRYQIYVMVTKEEDNSIKVDVQPLVFDFKDLEKKELEYTNKLEYTTISLKQNNEGDYKDLDRNTYFKYKLEINSKVGSIYTITGQPEKIIYNDEEIETINEYEVKEEDNYIYVYLKDGDKITIGLNELEFNEIPKDTEYTITKVNGEKWTTTINGKEIDTITLKTKAKDNEVLIINSRDYDNAVTGLMYNILPFILMILINTFLNKQTEVKIEQKSTKNTTLEINNEEESEMEVLNVTSANFEEEVLKSDKTVIIDFYADWCGPCKMFSPIIESVAQKNENIKVVKVNVDEAQELAIKYQVASIPTVIVIKNGEVANRNVGLISESELLELVK